MRAAQEDAGFSGGPQRIGICPPLTIQQSSVYGRSAASYRIISNQLDKEAASNGHFLEADEDLFFFIFCCLHPPLTPLGTSSLRYAFISIYLSSPVS